MATVEFYEDQSDPKEWRWRVKAANGQIIGASTEGYSREQFAKNNLLSIPKYCRDIDIKMASEMKEERPENARFPLEFYKDKADEWRWRLTAANGQIVGASSEGYNNKTAAASNLRGLIAAINEWSA